MTLNPAQDKFVLKRQLTPSPGFAKTTPYLPCTVTSYRPAYRRVPGSVPGAASGNAYYHNRRAVVRNARKTRKPAKTLTNNYQGDEIKSLRFTG